MPARHFNIGHVKRPTHAQIAATPLDRLPPHHRREAERLVQDGGAAIAQRLATPSAKLALRLQGVQVQDLVSAADLLHLEWSRCVTPGPGQRKKKLSSWEHAQQLLAQVLFEEEFLFGQGQAAATDQPAAEPSEAASEQYGVADVFGLRQRRPQRPPPTEWPLSRPQSARETRETLHSERLDTARRHWDERMRSVEGARVCRNRQLRSSQQQRHERHCQEEEHIGAFLAEQSRHMDAYGREVSASRKKRLEEQAGRFVADDQNFERSRTAESAVRTGAAWDKRAGCIQRQEEHLTGLVVAAAERQRGATGRHAEWVQTRSAGSPQLHTSRELAHWQAKRIAGLRQTERDVLKDCLDEPTMFTHRNRYD